MMIPQEIKNIYIYIEEQKIEMIKKGLHPIEAQQVIDKLVLGRRFEDLRVTREAFESTLKKLCEGGGNKILSKPILGIKMTK